jgi:hypothetical protein
MARTRKYYLKNNYLTLRSKVKVPQRSLRYATHRLMVMYPHTKYHWPISRQKCYSPDKKILFKNQLFELLHVACNYVSPSNEGRHIVLVWFFLPLLPLLLLLLLSEACPDHNVYWPISRQKCYSPDKKILFKNQLFDLEVKGQGPTKVISVRDTPRGL